MWKVFNAVDDGVIDVVFIAASRRRWFIMHEQAHVAPALKDPFGNCSTCGKSRGCVSKSMTFSDNHHVSR